MTKTVHFKTNRAYHKWLAYGHIHNAFHGREKIVIAGHKHHVEHTHKKYRKIFGK